LNLFAEQVIPSQEGRSDTVDQCPLHISSETGNLLLLLGVENLTADIDGGSVVGSTGWKNSSTTLALGGREVTKKADELGLRGGLGLDIIPLVVSVVARKGLATRDWGLGGSWVNLLDVGVVIWVDNGGYIEPGSGGTPSIERDLSEHTWDVIGTLLNGIEVTDPSVWEGDVLGSKTIDGDGVNGFLTLLWGEVDGALDRILVDEINAVGKSLSSHEGERKSGGGELHVCGFDFVNVL